MKPSERIREIRRQKKDEFDKENPYFFLDNGYEPDFRYEAIIEWLDYKFTPEK